VNVSRQQMYVSIKTSKNEIGDRIYENRIIPYKNKRIRRIQSPDAFISMNLLRSSLNYFQFRFIRFQSS